VSVPLRQARLPLSILEQKITDLRRGVWECGLWVRGEEMVNEIHSEDKLSPGKTSFKTQNLASVQHYIGKMRIYVPFSIGKRKWLGAVDSREKRPLPKKKLL